MLPDGYGTNDIRYCWRKKKDYYRESVSLEPDVRLPQFSISGYYLGQKIQNLTTGNYSRLSCKFVFSRSIGFYVIQIYLPSQLIVIISWVSFWLSRDATPARVSLGVTTVLTMTTLMTTTNNQMPKVSYIKSIDLYLGVCFIMVFASLLEYAAVGYLNKRLRMLREKKMQRINVGGSSESGRGPLLPSAALRGRLMPTFNDNFPGDPLEKEPAVEMGLWNSPGFLAGPTAKKLDTLQIPLHFPGQPEDTSRQRTASIHPGNYSGFGLQPAPASNSMISQLQRQLECDCDLEQPKRAAVSHSAADNPVQPLRFQRPKVHKQDGMTPSAIDKYSRMIFPILFAVFNALYWGISYHLSHRLVKRYISSSAPDIDPWQDDCYPENRTAYGL